MALAVSFHLAMDATLAVSVKTVADKQQIECENACLHGRLVAQHPTSCQAGLELIFSFDALAIWRFVDIAHNMICGIYSGRFYFTNRSLPEGKPW